MKLHNGSARRTDSFLVESINEHKSSSPAGSGREQDTPGKGGDITPTQSRPTSPLRIDNPELVEDALHRASASETSTQETNGIAHESGSDSSVDRGEEDTLRHHPPRDPEHATPNPSNVYESPSSSSPNSPFQSRSLPPRHRAAVTVTPNGIIKKDMSDSSARPEPSSDPSRFTSAARQKQQQQSLQHGLQPYSYYTTPSVPDPAFSRNIPSISSQNGHSPLLHAQQPSHMQGPTGFGGPYMMSPQPSSMYPQHHVQHQYSYPRISIPGMPSPLAHAHSQSSSEYYPVGHSASPSQPALYAPPFHTGSTPEHTPSPTIAFDYDGRGSGGRGPSTGAASPYSPSLYSPPPPSFASFGFHPTLTTTPQFTHSHSPFSSPFPTHQGQQAHRQQYPPSYTFMARASPVSSETTGRNQQQPSAAWWFIPPHSGSPSAGAYPNMYYVDAYGNPSNPALASGQSFPSLQSPSSTNPSDLSAFTMPGPFLSSESRNRSSDNVRVPQPRKEDLVELDSTVSSTRDPSSPIALGESVSERANQPPETQSRQGSRRPYLPNPPTQRSEWVMWVGNVPGDATHDELWRFFTRLSTPSSVQTQATYHHAQLQQPPHLPAGLLSPSGSSSAPDTKSHDASGVQSIFLIARSNCAFVNYASSAHLAAAVQRFNGVPLRPGDPRCPRLVCRVRGKEEDSKAGVGGQRGTGIHTRWIREQREREKAREQEQSQRANKEGASTDSETNTSEPPGTPLSTDITESGTESSPRSSGPRGPHHSSSSGSTTSGFLARYFPKRYFILKSLTQHDLDLSVTKGIWATQPHNETTLNQAYRNSSDVFLIFSVNKSGEFFGYARMAGPIGKTGDRISWASRADSQHSQHSHSPAASFTSSVPGKGTQVNETIPEENEGNPPENKGGDHLGEENRMSDEERRAFMLFSPSEHRLAMNSPQPVTPATQKRLTKAEEVDKGKVTPTAGYKTEPPTDQHYDFTPMPRSSEILSSARPSSPTSAPAVMGQPYRKITLPRLGDLSSETIDPRLLRRHLPDVHLDSEAPLRAVRDKHSRKSNKAHSAGVDADKLEHRARTSASGSGSASKLREVVQAEQLEPPSDEDSSPGPIEIGPIAPTQVEHGKGDDDSVPWGSPFKIKWIRVKKLPFTRTRHLRNPWNHEREVKVSRDGTELEPSVGQALLDEWDKDEPPGFAPTLPAVGTAGSGRATPGVGKRGTSYRRVQSQLQSSTLDDSELASRTDISHAQQRQLLR